MYEETKSSLYLPPSIKNEFQFNLSQLQNDVY
jgi:hypothetical protein